MGAEYYVHFGAGRRHDAVLAGRRPAGRRGRRGRDCPTRARVVVARLDSEAKVKVGEPTEVWVDATKLHFFDADSGENLSAA